MEGLAIHWRDNDSAEGLVDDIRVEGAAARRTLLIEAGPLLQVPNIISQKKKKVQLEQNIQISNGQGGTRRNVDGDLWI